VGADLMPVYGVKDTLDLSYAASGFSVTVAELFA
jgi:hypothetical protein